MLCYYHVRAPRIKPAPPRLNSIRYSLDRLAVALLNAQLCRHRRHVCRCCNTEEGCEAEGSEEAGGAPEIHRDDRRSRRKSEGARWFVATGDPEVHREDLQRRQRRARRQPAPEDGPEGWREERCSEAVEGLRRVGQFPSGRQGGSEKEGRRQEAEEPREGEEGEEGKVSEEGEEAKEPEEGEEGSKEAGRSESGAETEGGPEGEEARRSESKEGEDAREGEEGSEAEEGGTEEGVNYTTAIVVAVCFLKTLSNFVNTIISRTNVVRNL